MEDFHSLTGVYEEIYEHAKKAAEQLDELIRKIDGMDRKNFISVIEGFKQIGQVLVSLVSEYHFALKGEKKNQVVTEHDAILIEKRKEMFDHVFGLLQR